MTVDDINTLRRTVTPPANSIKTVQPHSQATMQYLVHRVEEHSNRSEKFSSRVEKLETAHNRTNATIEALAQASIDAHNRTTASIDLLVQATSDAHNRTNARIDALAQASADAYNNTTARIDALAQTSADNSQRLNDIAAREAGREGRSFQVVEHRLVAHARGET